MLSRRGSEVLGAHRTLGGLAGERSQGLPPGVEVPPPPGAAQCREAPADPPFRSPKAGGGRLQTQLLEPVATGAPATPWVPAAPWQKLSLAQSPGGRNQEAVPRPAGPEALELAAWHAAGAEGGCGTRCSCSLCLQRPTSLQGVPPG